MSSSETPGSPSAAYTQSLRRRRWSSPMVDGLDTSKSEPFRGYLLVRSRYNLPSCSPPLRDLYIRAFDRSVALPIAGYNYGVRLGNLHRWDFHPLERQLASLQPPSGSSVGVTRGYPLQIRTVIRGRGRGRCRRKSVNLSQVRRVRWLRRHSHLYQARFVASTSRSRLGKLPCTPK